MRKIVIVGGGIAGWTTACLLRKQFPLSQVAISLLDEDRYECYGAEATHPTIHGFHELIELDEKACLQNSLASFGLGLLYQGWSNPQQHFCLSPGQYGASLRGVPFSQIYAKARHLDVAQQFDSYSLNAVAAQYGRFGHPLSDPQSIYAQINYGLHLREDEYKQLLRSHAVAAGVDVIVANCASVNLNQGGAIESLGLDNQQTISGDLFFDCTGRARVLCGSLGGHLIDDVGGEMVDRCAWGVRLSPGINSPAAIIVPQPHGYLKVIPLHDQEVLRYYYSSRQLNQGEVLQQMQRWGVVSAQVADVGFYRSEAFWQKNCVGLGEAACAFPETYISNLHVVRNSIVRFLDLFMSFDFMEASAGEYNRLSSIEFALIKDFTELNFYLARHNTIHFKDYFLSRGLSKTACHRLQLFQLTGRHPHSESHLLSDSEWAALFLGGGVVPQAYEMILDTMSDAVISTFMKKLDHAYRQAIEPMPLHRDYIKKLKIL